MKNLCRRLGWLGRSINALLCESLLLAFRETSWYCEQDCKSLRGTISSGILWLAGLCGSPLAWLRGRHEVGNLWPRIMQKGSLCCIEVESVIPSHSDFSTCFEVSASLTIILYLKRCQSVSCLLLLRKPYQFFAHIGEPWMFCFRVNNNGIISRRQVRHGFAPARNHIRVFQRCSKWIWTNLCGRFL